MRSKFEAYLLSSALGGIEGSLVPKSDIVIYLGFPNNLSVANSEHSNSFDFPAFPDVMAVCLEVRLSKGKGNT
jgi:hypothetical protein